MAARSRPKTTRKVESYEVTSTTIGPAFAMPEGAAEAMAAMEAAPIDFQARQDSIAPTRRDPGEKLAPKLKRTTAKPAKAKETKVRL